MKLEKVSDEDRTMLKMRGKWIALTAEFMNSDMDMVEIKGVEGDVKCAYRNIRSAIRRRNLPIVAMMRKGRIFLVKDAK